MKKECPICDKIFTGRSDKLFCSVHCKNQFHNQQRRQSIVNNVDQQLHQNRSILQQLIPPEVDKDVLERNILDRLGFSFNSVTSVEKPNDNKVVYRIYEYAWTESTDGAIVVERFNTDSISV